MTGPTIGGRLASNTGPHMLFLRVAAGWSTFVVALFGATVVGEVLRATLGVPPVVQQFVQAVVVAGVVVPAIYALLRFDGKSWRWAGMSSPASGLPYFLLGIGLVLGTAGVSLGLGVAAGWLRVVSWDLPVATMLALAANIPIALLYEALPEELAFRGYLYSNLNSRFVRWLALLGGVVLFVLAPVTVIVLQKAVGMQAGNSITVDYVVLLTGFGFVLQLCRIVTGSLWTNIGFHLAWLELSRYVVAPRTEPLVRIEDVAPGTSEVLVLFLGAIVGGSLLLLVWPRLRGRRVGWRERVPGWPAN